MPSLTITLIQTELYWQDKAANLSMLEEKIKNVKGKKEIVVLPEMFTTGFTMQPAEYAETMNGNTLEWMKRVSRENRIILTGSIIVKESGDYFNRLIWMRPDGIYGFYDKRHLFAYAGEDKEYTKGSKRFIASVKGWKINMQICYDLRFPVWSRQSTATRISSKESHEYDVLIYSANWPKSRIKAWQTLLQARAIENQCFVAGVNRIGLDGNNIDYSGSSMLVDPEGNVLYQGGDKDEIFTITLEKEVLERNREKFPFWQDADSFILPPL